jgi:hypothetical protein
VGMPTNPITVGRVACERIILEGEHGISIQSPSDMFCSWICAESLLTSEFVLNGMDELQAFEPSNFEPIAHCQKIHLSQNNTYLVEASGREVYNGTPEAPILRTFPLQFNFKLPPAIYLDTDTSELRCIRSLLSPRKHTRPRMCPPMHSITYTSCVRHIMLWSNSNLIFEDGVRGG